MLSASYVETNAPQSVGFLKRTICRGDVVLEIDRWSRQEIVTQWRILPRTWHNQSVS